MVCLMLQTTILSAVRSMLAMAKDDPAKEEKVKELRTDINSWVASYRREPIVAGRPSFGCVLASAEPVL